MRLVTFFHGSNLCPGRFQVEMTRRPLFTHPMCDLC